MFTCLCVTDARASDYLCSLLNIGCFVCGLIYEMLLTMNCGESIGVYGV